MTKTRGQLAMLFTTGTQYINRAPNKPIQEIMDSDSGESALFRSQLVATRETLRNDKLKKQILRGRELSGEPADFDF